MPARIAGSVGNYTAMVIMLVFGSTGMMVTQGLRVLSVLIQLSISIPMLARIAGLV
jgi:hypothetical protein